MKRQERRREFLGLHFDDIFETEAIRHILSLAGADNFSYVVTPNVDHLVQLHKQSGDEKLWASYMAAELCLCDSRILQAMAAASGIHLNLIPGSDLTVALLWHGSEFATSVAIIGGSEAILTDLELQFPSARWHLHVPPMGVRSNAQAQEEIICFIEATGADVVFFAIGAPQSELLCHRLMMRKRARGVALCIGASLEFVTGAKRRAPRWIQRLKMEWLFRLSAEPRRLARRYLVEGPKIFRIWYSWRRTRLRRPVGGS